MSELESHHRLMRRKVTRSRNGRMENLQWRKLHVYCSLEERQVARKTGGGGRVV